MKGGVRHGRIELPNPGIPTFAYPNTECIQYLESSSVGMPLELLFTIFLLVKQKGLPPPFMVSFILCVDGM